MCNKLGWKKSYPYIVKVPCKSDPIEINQWLTNQYGCDIVKLSSGKQRKLPRKAGVWAYDSWDYTGASYRFCNEEYMTWFLLRWS